MISSAFGQDVQSERPGSQGEAEIKKVVWGLFFFYSEGEAKTQVGAQFLERAGNFSHTQNPIKIYPGILQPRVFSYLPICFITICEM